MFQARVITLIATVLALASFQNCSPSFKVTEGSGLALSSEVIDRLADPVAGTLESLRASSVQYAGIDSSLTSGTYDNNCLNSTVHDACIFWKSPVASKEVFGGTDIPILSNSQAAAPAVLEPHLKFGIQLTVGSLNSLRTADFDIHYLDEAGVKRALPLVNGQFRRPLSHGYAAATPVEERFSTEQIQTSHYLNLLKTTLLQKAGTFFAAGRNISVNVFSTAAGFNAFFDPQSNAVEIGFRQGDDGQRYSLALNGEVAVHEMAHANLHHANLSLSDALTDLILVVPCQRAGPKRFFLSDFRNFRMNEAGVLSDIQATCGHNDFTGTTSIHYCVSDRGCVRAIDEGQADFFSHVVFPRWPTVGELALPNDLVRFWKKRGNITRDQMASRLGFSYVDDFLAQTITRPGEIHDAGEVYAEILFDIYVMNSVDKNTFVRTVSEHLRQLTGTSTFSDSKAILLSIDQSLFAGRNQNEIRAAFQNRGF